MPLTTSRTQPVDKWNADKRKQFWKEIAALQVAEGKKANLSRRSTEYSHKTVSKNDATAVLDWGKARLAEMQDALYAENQRSLLIVLQAMDTAGKDGAIKHIMSGLNPQGVKVTPFKKPSAEELDHDFLWRHYKALPARGDIGIFNRSHYENVLVSRVHPELVLAENLPTVKKVKDVDEKFWDERYEVIRQFEDVVVKNGTIILKFYLHLSHDEQKRRLISRIDDKEKNWKFSISDMEERSYWNDYQVAYEKAITATSTQSAPWFVVPADNKWYTRLAIAAIIYHHMDKLKLKYPSVSKEQEERLKEARERLVQGQI